jgi:hypothetical protein
MPRAKELKIRVENRPGMLGEVASALAAGKVDIRAANAWVEGGEGVVRLVVDKVPAARKALAKRGWRMEELEILAVELPDKPGALAGLASALGAAGVDIGHLYVGAARARKAAVYLGVSDLGAAAKVAARVARAGR